ncbi:hypothetical protein [Myxococcus qinghaiensis]|uniref:hypothetical protein n=1 Tax=Myxococcus qinghaiensis TaxID=2906758 RepID=UPI0020A6E070|nr:hypothetical protein [Myxococcus qinghaiensis]MCP3166305.1 hypothetical protein [Myxococcus qinghaiensis]
MDESLHPDILDALGRQPREFGAVQLHVEPILQPPGGTEARAVIWLQAAFAPLPPSMSLRVVDAVTRREVRRGGLPSLEGGRVLRWVLPLTLDADMKELLFLIEAPVPEDAMRVRPPWRLFDTLEQVEVQPVARPLSSTLLRAGVFASTGVGLPALAVALAPSMGLGPAEPGTRRHVARAMPEGFIAAVTPGVFTKDAEPGSTLIWEPGQDLDTARWAEATDATENAARVRCTCGAVAPRDAEFCPRCLASLAGATRESSPPVFEALSAGMDPTPTEAPTEATTARCPRHPRVEEVQSCPRCGGFFCEACLPETLASERTHCADCLDREREPAVLRRALLRDLIITQCGVAALVVVMGTLSTMASPKGEPFYPIMGTLCLASPVLGLAGLAMLTRSAIPGWIAVPIDLLFGVAIFLLGGYLIGALILLCAVISCFQLFKLHSLSSPPPTVTEPPEP